MNKPHYRLQADGQVMHMNDGIRNVVANLGTPRDKAHSSHYVRRILTDKELSDTYSSWLGRRLVDLIPEDATSKWRAWQAKSDQISKLEAEEKRLGLVIKTKEAMISARLFGFAAIYISTGESDVSKPLESERIKKGGIKHLTVMGKNHLTPDEAETDPDSPWFGKPKMYRINAEGKSDVLIHPSRLIVFYGAPRPVGDIFTSFHMSPKAVGGGAYFSGYNAWGDSILQLVYDALKSTDSTMANIASLIYEANVDVLHIPRLMELLKKPGGEAAVQSYLHTLMAAKGNNGMLVLDGGDTTKSEGQTGGTKYERKGANFAGLSDIWDRFMMVVAAAGRYPVTYFWGRSPGGLNSTGEAEIRNYAKTLSTIQAMEIQPAMGLFDEALIYSALGSRPEEIHFNWNPTFESTQKEKAETGKIVADIIKTLKDAELFPVETLQAAAANAMIETGSLPGLEGAIDEHGLELEEEDEGDDPLLQAAALGLTLPTGEEDENPEIQ